MLTGVVVAVGVPEQQALTVRIARVRFDARSICAQIPTFERLLKKLCKLLEHAALNVFLAGRFDSLQTGSSLLTAQSFQFFDSGSLTDVLLEDGDVNVFGEPFDQAKTLGERCAAFEKQAWAIGLQLIEERVEQPAIPEILFDVLCARAKSGSGADKQVKAVLIARGQHRLKAFGHLLL